MRFADYLQETPLLDFSRPEFDLIVEGRGWRDWKTYDQIGAVHDFVQNDIPFGYNLSDDMPASSVLSDGYGQCNTKTNLAMALFRKLGIPCRFHGFWVHKSVQRGVVSEFWYHLAPEHIIHSWAEILYQERWVNLEGFILDKLYVRGLRKQFGGVNGGFCGYGVATNDFVQPPMDWKGTATYIQKESIVHDFGIFDSPDVFYQQHGTNLKGVRRMLFQYLIRHQMNRNVLHIRKGRCPGYSFSTELPVKSSGENSQPPVSAANSKQEGLHGS